jgi:hypothetical protein
MRYVRRSQHEGPSSSPYSICAGASQRGHVGIGARWTLGGADGGFDEICVKEASEPSVLGKRCDPCLPIRDHPALVLVPLTTHFHFPLIAPTRRPALLSGLPRRI